MLAWYSPLSFSAITLDQLHQAGYEAWQGDPADLPSDGLFLYDTPERCFGLSPQVLRDGYEQLLQPPVQRRVVAVWRLLDLDPSAGLLEMALTFALLQADPVLLEAYVDLELKADLLGGEPDVGCKQRLVANLQPGQLLEAWQELQSPSVAEAQLEVLATAEREAREETELILLQLHQVQEELETIFLAEREKSAEVKRLKHQLSNLSAAAREQEVVRIQVQEELEHYLCLSRAQRRQLERYNQLQRRSLRLLARLAV